MSSTIRVNVATSVAPTTLVATIAPIQRKPTLRPRTACAFQPYARGGVGPPPR
jgi:hypothetical protein